MKVNIINITNNPIETIFKAYRICYSKSNYEEVKVPMIVGEDGVERKDIDKMIRFIEPLVKMKHESPLEHVSITFSIEGISRACLSQLTRHRIASYNCQSQRYVDGKNFNFVTPTLDYIEDEEKRMLFKECYKEIFEILKNSYQSLVALGARKEDARAILPQATTCNLTMTINLRSFRNFLKLRMDKAAQEEIRQLATEMCKLVKEYIPFVDSEL